MQKQYDIRQEGWLWVSIVYVKTQVHFSKKRGSVMKNIQGKAEVKSFLKPDEVRDFPRGKVELVNIGGTTVGRAVFQPGWRWSTSLKPMVLTKSCEAPHFQYHVSGTLNVVMDDGSEFECKAGDVSLFHTGHDAWVVGDDPVVVVDFQGMIDYARQPAGAM
jgi:hypothetical protein